jgi:hypothetical protein
LTLGERGALERARAIRIFLLHPQLTAQQFIEGGFRLFAVGLSMSCDVLNPEVYSGECKIRNVMQQAAPIPVGPRILIVWNLILLVAVYSGACAGVIWLARNNMWFPLGFLLLVVGYFVLISSGAETNTRMRVPFFPYLSILFGVGAFATTSLIWQRMSRATWQRMARSPS